MKTPLLLVGCALSVLLLLGGCPASAPTTGGGSGGQTSNTDDGGGDDAGDTGDTGDDGGGSDDGGSVGGDDDSGDGDGGGSGDDDGSDDSDGSGDDGGSGGGGGDDDDDDDVTLSNAQADAIDSATDQLAWVANVMATFSLLSDDRLDLDSMSQLISFGDCPRVQGAGGATPILNFLFTDEGCTSDRTGAALIQGPLQIDIVGDTKAATVVFEFSAAQHDLDFLTIAGQLIAGNVVATIANVSAGVSLDGQCNLTIENVTAASGAIELIMAEDGGLTLDAASLLLDDDATPLTVAVADLEFDPVGTGDFIPVGGTVTLTVDGDTLTVTYDADSPVDGGVSVAVDGAGATTHTLP